MEVKYMSDNFTVYMHITPSKKRYIGLTNQQDVDKRFGSNGIGYKYQIFYRAVQKYGWDNIEHIIVAENLSKDEAKALEIELIAKYDTTNPKYGYNMSIGGDIPVIYGKHHTEATKQKISNSNKGKKISQETRDKLSDSIKKLWETQEYRDKQNSYIVSDETKIKLSLSHKGHVHTEEQKKKISNSNKGKHNFSEEDKKKIAETVHLQHQKEKELGIKRNMQNNGKHTEGTKWYNNGEINIRSKESCPEGFVPGRLHYEYPKNRKSRIKLW
jgi:hypothetical protein